MNQMSQKKAFEENSFAEAMVNAVTVWKIVTENVTGKMNNMRDGCVHEWKPMWDKEVKRAGNVPVWF